MSVHNSPYWAVLPYKTMFRQPLRRMKFIGMRVVILYFTKIIHV